MFLRRLRRSSLCLSAGAAYICLLFEDGCFCAVCAAACNLCWQELRIFSSAWFYFEDGYGRAVCATARGFCRQDIRIPGPLPLVGRWILLRCLRI